MQKRSRKIAKSHVTTPLSDVLFQVSQSLALDEKIGEMALVRLWPQVVPAEFLNKTEAMTIKRQNNQRILQVKAVHAACAAQLSFHLPDILEKLNGYAPQTGCRVDKIEIRNGSRS